ncbi:hypothetical protein [Candidatus Xianfuyuplasma coldseepsis]|uniref:Uncharacterized protein n=1 Tax=Candidatus Xianfuyuplasma coldseepsis TaxID=2782163 RepID=A0A7L7KS96_9MOLU|nr:hypothetical protein [Xianfuyuplasma coldseepsis]QMS85132.1 hypothetical protein G4Z02_05030 [Xianfuyuplasma coldseepsis]
MSKKGILVIVFALLFVLSSCQSDEKKFDEAIENTENLTSARVDFSMDNVPIFGSIAGYMLYSGDQYYTSFFGEQSYELEIDGVTYELVEFDDVYYAKEVEEDIEDILGEEDDFTSMYEDFNSENFVLGDDGYYVSTESYDDMTDIKVKIEDGYIIEIMATVDSEGFVMDLTMELSGFNETTIDFPEYEMMNDHILVISSLVDEGYEYQSSDVLIRFESWNEDIDYWIGADHFEIDGGWNDAVIFYPETQTVEVNELPAVSLELYLTEEVNPIVEQVIFDLLTDYYNTLD